MKTWKPNNRKMRPSMQELANSEAGFVFKSILSCGMHQKSYLLVAIEPRYRDSNLRGIFLIILGVGWHVLAKIWKGRMHFEGFSKTLLSNSLATIQYRILRNRQTLVWDSYSSHQDLPGVKSLISLGGYLFWQDAYLIRWDGKMCRPQPPQTPVSQPVNRSVRGKQLSPAVPGTTIETLPR